MTYEIERQSEVLDKGGTISQETRLWNENRDQTEIMRSKENSNDYRYFPEPDLPPFTATADFLKSLDSMMVELPIARRERFVREYGVSVAQAEFLCEEREVADYFENVAKQGIEPLTIATWMGSDVQKHLNRTGTHIHLSPLTEKRFGSLLGALAKERINGKLAKQVLDLIFEENKDPEDIIRERGLEQNNDPNALAAAIDAVLAANPKAVGEVKAGDSKPLGFLMGQVMKATGGRADPKMIQDILNAKLK